VPHLTDPPAGMPQEVVDFRVRTVMPDEDVDELWTQRQGFLEAALRGALADIYARLRKRYKVPFNPKPEIVVAWQTKLVTPEAYRARGYNPSDTSLEGAEKDRERVYEQIKEAADSKDGLFDLPLDDAADATAIGKGGPLSYSEAGPYEWTDVQRRSLRER
jgi:hypothetical protein